MDCIVCFEPLTHHLNAPCCSTQCENEYYDEQALRADTERMMENSLPTS
jgi:hypothetical protein